MVGRVKVGGPTQNGCAERLVRFIMEEEVSSCHDEYNRGS